MKTNCNIWSCKNTVLTQKNRQLNIPGILLPLVLFAALAAVLCALFGIKREWFALLSGAAVVCACTLLPKRWSWIARLVFAAGAACVLLLVPSVNMGAKLLANRLLTASEAVNAYAYHHFDVSAADEAAAVRLALLVASVLLGVLCSMGTLRAWTVLLFLAAAFLEGYFGVTPGVWRNLLLFAALALLLVCGISEVQGGAVMLAGMAVIVLAICLIAPRPIAAVETYSEHLRDELGSVALRVTQQASQPKTETNSTHQESRQHEEASRPDATQESTLQEYERHEENEQEISLPHRIDYLKIVLWMLLIVALLVVPFLPFLLLNRARRRVEEKRAAFAVKDNAAAIRAMFTHTMDWLRTSGLQTENRQFSQCAGAIETLTGADYAAQFADAAAIWQEAVYSDHDLTDEQRQIVRELLERTASMLYERADKRTRFRMNYVACLVRE